MTSSITSVMAAAGLQPGGIVRWGELINTDEPGIYVVSTTRDIDIRGNSPRLAPLDLDALDHLLLLRPNLTVDGGRPTRDELAERLSEFWLPDEHVLYIGLAADLHNRVNQYYGTPLGARRPHAGGWFLKTLSGLNELYVHWSITYERVTAEELAIGSFVADVSAGTMEGLRDRERPFPFANLEWPAGTRKSHGIRGAKTARERAPGTESGRNERRTGTREAAAATGPPPATLVGLATGGGATQTQRVTHSDIAGGRIRIPRRGKHLFPQGKGTLDLRLRGAELKATWDPRLGPPERSGVIGIPKEELKQRVLPDQVLIASFSDPLYVLD